MKVLLLHEEPCLMHLAFSSTVSHTGHHGWYWIRVLGASKGTASAVAAPTMARKKVAACD